MKKLILILGSYILISSFGCLAEQDKKINPEYYRFSRVMIIYKTMFKEKSDTSIVNCFYYDGDPCFGDRHHQFVYYNKYNNGTLIVSTKKYWSQDYIVATDVQYFKTIELDTLVM